MTPYIDDGTAALVDEAATNLILTRAPMLFGDAGPSISVLVSLVPLFPQVGLRISRELRVGRSTCEVGPRWHTE